MKKYIFTKDFTAKELLHNQGCATTRFFKKNQIVNGRIFMELQPMLPSTAKIITTVGSACTYDITGAVTPAGKGNYSYSADAESDQQVNETPPADKNEDAFYAVVLSAIVGGGLLAWGGYAIAKKNNKDVIMGSIIGGLSGATIGFFAGNAIRESINQSRVIK
jgi:hypothetical protein